MNEKEKADIRKRIRQWEETAKVADKLRREYLRNIDMEQIV